MSPVYLVPAVLGVLSLIGSAVGKKRKAKVGSPDFLNGEDDGAQEASSEADPLAAMTEGADEIEPAGMPADDEPEDVSETSDTPPEEGAAPGAAPPESGGGGGSGGGGAPPPAASAPAPGAAPTTSAANTKPPAVPRYPVGSRVLIPKALPMRGTDVAALQIMLNGLGTNPKLRVDGVYNQITLRAVRSHQARHRLPTTGVVDRAMWTRLLAGVPPKLNAPKSAAPRRSTKPSKPSKPPARSGKPRR